MLGRFWTFPDRVVGMYEYTQHHHVRLQARGECILGRIRMAHTQVHAQQRLVRELEMGRAATELQPAPSKPRSWRCAAKQHAADFRWLSVGMLFLLFIRCAQQQ